MKLAIIGTGISGLTAAHLLAADHDLTIYEANDYVGGHTHTIDVESEGKSWAVDTGFIVFNELTYPNLIKLFESLGVDCQDSTMSFSVRCDKTGLEYRPSSLNTLFAQRKNILRPAFWRMIRGIMRFRREFPELLKADMSLTLGDCLEQAGYPSEFIDYFIVPMGAAIWSSGPDAILEFSAPMFVKFLANHGVLKFRDRPQWRVVSGGSRTYVEKLIAPFENRIRLNCPVRKIRRSSNGVTVEADGQSIEIFDEVIIATHSDQALSMLADPSENEKDILEAIPYQKNTTVLHTDSSLLPRCRRAWASWNYHIPTESQSKLALTYYMNMLQSLSSPVDFCVTLNRTDDIDPSLRIVSMVYEHPIYTTQTPAAQDRHAEISGKNHTHYCGAYWGYGFHEDGVNSALAVCRSFGKYL